MFECKPFTSKLLFPSLCTHPAVMASNPVSVNNRRANLGSSIANRKFVRVASFRLGGRLGKSGNVLKYETKDWQVSEERQDGRSIICESRIVTVDNGDSIGRGVITGKATWTGGLDRVWQWGADFFFFVILRGSVRCGKRGYRSAVRLNAGGHDLPLGPNPYTLYLKLTSTTCGA